MASLARRYSPGIMPSPYGLMDGDEFRAVRKRAFHLDLFDHLAHTLHHGVARKNRRPDARDLGDRLTVADELEEFGGDEGNRFRVIQSQAARAPLSGELTGAEDHELVDFAWSQVHGRPSPVSVVALLAPRVAVVVIAARLPEPGLI